MLGATVSTCKASCFSQINDWCSWRQWALAKHCGCSQLHDLCLWRQSALVNHPCFRSYMIDVCGDNELPPQTSIMELRNMNALQVLAVATNINHGVDKKQYGLQVLAVATIINHGAANNWMRYMSSLSHQASILELRKTGCFTTADCRKKQLDDLQVTRARVRVRVTVGVGVETHWMFYHCSL